MAFTGKAHGDKNPANESREKKKGMSPSELKSLVESMGGKAKSSAPQSSPFSGPLLPKGKMGGLNGPK